MKRPAVNRVIESRNLPRPASRRQASIAPYGLDTPVSPSLHGNGPRATARKGGRLLAIGLLALLPAAVHAASPREELNLQTFDAVWRLVDETHFDPDLNGVDWAGVRDELRPRAARAADERELRLVLQDMIDRLGQSHFAVISAGSWGEADAPHDGEKLPKGCRPAANQRILSLLQNGTGGDANPGLELIDLDGEVLIGHVEPLSPADERRIKPGWKVVAVGREKLADALPCFEQLDDPSTRRQVRRTWLASLLAGAPDSLVDLLLETGSGRRKSLTLARQPPPGKLARFGNLPPQRVRFTSDLVVLDDGTRVGRVKFNLWFLPVAAAIEQAVEALRDADGFVIDLRGNPGGLAAIAQGVAGHFVRESTSLGALLSRRSTLELAVQPRRVTRDGRLVEPWSGPLAILLDEDSGSTSEVFAAGLHDIGRARLFGHPSAGAALPAITDRLPNGDVFLHATMDYVRPNGKRVEGNPVQPDVAVETTRVDLLAGHDPVFDAAAEWIRSRVGEGTG